MKQFILKIPENTSFEALDDEVKAAIAEVKGVFPKGRVANSEAVLGYEIKLVQANVKGVELESQFLSLDLDWEVLAEEGEVIDESLILPFMLPKITLDENGEILTSEPLTDLSSLQTYSGKSWAF